MYEDEPQDRVHDVLAQAIHGDHPLGRRVLGDAAVIESIPVAEIAVYHHERYTAPNVVVAAAGHLDHARDRGAGPPRFMPAPAGAAGPAAQWRESEDDAAVRVPGQGHRAVPHLLRRPGHRPCGRAPLRAERSRRRLRWLDFVSAVPRGSREAGPGVRGRFLHRAVHGARRGRHVRRHPRGERRARPARSSAASSASLRDQGVSAEELERAKEHVKGRMVLGLEATGRADDASGPRDPLRRSPALTRRDARCGSSG